MTTRARGVWRRPGSQRPRGGAVLRTSGPLDAQRDLGDVVNTGSSRAGGRGGVRAPGGAERGGPGDVRAAGDPEGAVLGTSGQPRPGRSRGHQGSSAGGWGEAERGGPGDLRVAGGREGSRGPPGYWRPGGGPERPRPEASERLPGKDWVVAVSNWSC